MGNIAELKNIASQVRRDIVRMVHSCQSGHPGGSLGCADYLVALYFFIMKHDPNPATNKKHLRKKYKPRKLTQDEAYDLYQRMDRDFNELFDLSGDPIALFRGSEHSQLEEIAKEVDDEKENI